MKQKTRQALGWKSTEGALASLHEREVWTMLKQEQIDIEGDTAFERFFALAGKLYLENWSVTLLARFATEPEYVLREIPKLKSGDDHGHLLPWNMPKTN